MSKEWLDWYKRVWDITSIKLFPSSNFTLFLMVLSWFEVIASYIANLKVNFECSSCSVWVQSKESSEQASVFTIISPLKYKTVLYSLK